MEELEKEMKKRKNMFDDLLNILRGDENSPTCFKMLKKQHEFDLKVNDILRKIVDNESIQKEILSFFEQNIKILEDIEKQIQE